MGVIRTPFVGVHSTIYGSGQISRSRGGHLISIGGQCSLVKP